MQKRLLCILPVLIPFGLIAETVTLGSLLDEMTSRDTLARLDETAFTVRQFSSYDRASVDRSDPVGWFANLDQSQYLRTETVNGRSEDVMMDTEGPGAIVRFWITMSGPHSGKGILRIYLDGETVPVIEGNPFDIISRGKLAPAPFSQSVALETEELRRGHNLYLPIPYKKSCKVTFERQGEGAFYYNINYRTYEPGTRVRTFNMKDLEAAGTKLKRIGKRIEQGLLPDLQELREEALNPGRLEPGESTMTTLSGARAVRALKVSLEADDMEQALRSTVIELSFDGEETTWVPVGEFFGTGYKPVDLLSLVGKATADGTFWCYWVMPFKKSAEIRLVNHGNQPVEVRSLAAYTSPWKWDERSLHFHATWHELYQQETLGARKAIDVNYVSVKGKGKYVGDTLSLFNAGFAWWGEGDEKIYVDGEDFPSHFGTGTEDYYGYAWCRSETFQSPFILQPWGDGSGNRDCTSGYVVNSRWRMLDAIPFNESIDFYMELWHWWATKVNYAPTAFFYARPGAGTNRGPDPVAVAHPVPQKRIDVLGEYKTDLVFEGESLGNVSTHFGQAGPQSLEQLSFSGDSQLWWRNARPDDSLMFSFECDERLRHEIHAGLTLAPNYGIVDITLNGELVVEGLNLHANGLETKEVFLGYARLTGKTNFVTITMRGFHNTGQLRGGFGLDYLRITR
ncbi:MAG: glycoside hydrolase family 172 protein [Puniceicoccaceae bacterium]